MRQRRKPVAPRASLRVLHLLAGTAFAGTERHVLALAHAQRALGCDAELGCLPSATELRAAAGLAAVPVRSPSGLLRGPAPDIVHVHDGRSAVIGSGLAAGYGSRLVRTQHFVRPASVERGGVLGETSVAVHRAINRRLGGYICVSEAAARAARTRRDVPAGRLTVIPSGVSIPSDAEHASAVAWRAAATRPVVLSAGRLEPERRFDVLLDAAALVLAEVPECEFVIAGAGSAAAELETRARTLGIDASLRFTGWLEDLAPTLARAHLYVNTWPWEGFGMATAEAMGFGLPVVVADSGASPELIEDGVSGRLVKAADPRDLAATLVAMLSDLPGAAAMGLAARQRAGGRYSMPATAEATLALYAELLPTADER